MCELNLLNYWTSLDNTFSQDTFQSTAAAPSAHKKYRTYNKPYSSKVPLLLTPEMKHSAV